MRSCLISRQEAATELLRRREARRGLLAFTKFTKSDYEVGWHHRLLCSALDRFVAGQVRRLMVFMPPRHGKSELVSRRLPAYILGRFPDDQIIACAYAASLASAMNRDVQRCMDSPEYRQLFPATRLSGKNVRSDASGAYLRNSDLFEVVDRRGSYRSSGIGGGIVGMGFKWGVIDDYYKNREEADSPTISDGVWDWYLSSFYTRRTSDAGILICATRWGENDLAGRLLKLAEENPGADQWEVIRLPAVCEAEGECPGDPRKLGEALWPERFPVEELSKLREASSYEWDSQYQQRPRNRGLVEWPDEYFGPHLWFDEWPHEDIVCRAMAIDPSKGKADKSGDYSAIVALGVDRQRNLWIDADLDNGRPVEPLEGQPGGRSLVEDTIAAWTSFRATGVLVETNGFQEWVARALLKASKSRNLAMPLYTINNTVPKVQRIRTLGTYLAQRRLRVRKSKGGRMLVQQMRDFPTGAHDDGPDALKMAEQMADYLMRGKQGGDAVQLLRA